MDGVSGMMAAISAVWERWSLRMAMVASWLWVGAASLVGIEVLMLVLDSSLIFPELFPFVIIVLGSIFFLRERLHLRHDDDY